MTIEHKRDGSVELSSRIEKCDILFRRRYYGYTLSESKDKFRGEMQREKQRIGELNGYTT